MVELEVISTESNSEWVISPIYYQNQSQECNTISCKSLYQIEQEKNKKEGLVKQPNWAQVHKDDVGTMSTQKKLFVLFKPVVIVVLVTYILFNVIFLHGFVPSESMETTIMTGEFLLSYKLAYVTAPPRRGDIVVFKNLDEPTLLIKRVIGVPGDTVELFGGNVYINGCKLIEPYVQGKTYQLKTDKSKFVVPDGSVFLLGDNRENSLDSRAWENNFVPYQNIEGKAIIKYSIEDDSWLPKFSLIQSEDLIFSSDYFSA